MQKNRELGKCMDKNRKIFVESRQTNKYPGSFDCVISLTLIQVANRDDGSACKVKGTVLRRRKGEWEVSVAGVYCCYFREVGRCNIGCL